MSPPPSEEEPPETIMSSQSPNSPRPPKPRVLMIAEAANPEWVSVPLVGWSHAHALSQIADAHLVTQVRNREAIERFGWTEGKEFTAIDSEALSKRLYQAAKLLRGGSGKGWTTVTALGAFSYLYFEQLFWKQFQGELAAGKWDLVHRITPLSPTAPSFLASKLKKLGVPYVVGPLNGGVPWPKEFDSARRAEKEWLSYVRGAYRMLPGYRALRKDASALIVGSKDTRDQMPAWCRDRLAYIPENAIDPSRFDLEASAQATPEPGAPLRVAFVGRLVPYKGVDMLLEAAAPLVREGKVVIDIIGDGPERQNLKALQGKLGLEQGVELSGFVPHQELSDRLSRSQVLGFPSVREFGGGVVLEAMALGLAPVVVAYGGPAELVTKKTGVALPIGPREQIIAGMREALTELADDPERVMRLGTAAQQRVRDHFTWARKAEQTYKVYEWVLGRQPHPNFPLPLPDPVAEENSSASA